MNIKTTLRVDGMTCGHCVRHVTQALDEVPGVAGSTVDLAQKTATVEHGAAVTSAALIAAIADAGYDAAPLPS